MAKLNAFYETAPTKLVNYDWFDVTSLTGYKDFYGAKISGGYILTPQVIHTRTNDTATASQYYWTQFDFDVDFDIEVRKQFVLDGEAYVQIPILRKNTSGAGATLANWITVNIIHYDGTTETILATKKDGVSVNINNGVNQQLIASFSMEIPQTVFKVGEIVRLNVVGTQSGGSSDTRTGWLMHDPPDRTVTGIDTTQLKIQLPFRIED